MTISKETSTQRKTRLQYEKLYQDALNAGPIDHTKLADAARDFYSWQWCQISHVVSAMGGFSNFHYWVTEEAANHFHVNEELQERLDSARAVLTRISREKIKGKPTQGALEAKEWLEDHPVDEEEEILNDLATAPVLPRKNRRDNEESRNWRLMQFNKNLHNLASEGFDHIGSILLNLDMPKDTERPSWYKNAVKYFNSRRVLLFNTSEENTKKKDSSIVKKENKTLQ